MIHPASNLPKNRRQPHVHVVVPCFRYGHFLDACVRSIVSQRQVRTTVHIIDDASPDDSFAVAKRLEQRYKNVTADRNEVNLGHIATYNKGLSAADSDYLVLLSADDQLAPGALERATALMEKHSEVGLVYGHPNTFETEITPSRTSFCTWSIWAGQNWIDKQFRRGLNIIYSPEAVVRTSLHHDVGYYRPELPHAGDLEMWLRLAARAHVGRINGPDQAYRRVHSASMMNSNFAGVVTDLEERRRAFEWYLDSAEEAQRVRDHREAMMRRRLAEEALAWAADARRTDATLREVDAAIVFGLRTYPQARQLPVWPAATDGATYGAMHAASNVRRLVGDKIRWQRWRHLGI